MAGCSRPALRTGKPFWGRPWAAGIRFRTGTEEPELCNSPDVVRCRSIRHGILWNCLGPGNVGAAWTMISRFRLQLMCLLAGFMQVFILSGQPVPPVVPGAAPFVSKDLDGDGVADFALRSATTTLQEMIFIPPTPPFGSGGLTLITFGLESRWIGFPPDATPAAGAEIHYLGAKTEQLHGTSYPAAIPAVHLDLPSPIPNTSHSEIYGIRFSTAMGLRNGWAVFSVTNIPSNFGAAVKNYTLVASGFEPRESVPVVIGSPTPPRVRIQEVADGSLVELVDCQPLSTLEIKTRLEDSTWHQAPPPSEETGSRRVWKLDLLRKQFSSGSGSLFFRVSARPGR